MFQNCFYVENTTLAQMSGQGRFVIFPWIEKGFFLKDIHPDELEEALQVVIDKGYYYSERVTSSMVNALHPRNNETVVKLKENELTFLQLACSEMTYKEVADVMNLSPKTIDGYRQELFNKLLIKNRVGLVIYALKNNLVEL